jgi:methylase of polypeptide subunit release factors
VKRVDGPSAGAIATDLSAPDQALFDLLRALKARGYAFVTPTPATHARVVARPDRRAARDLRDVFGWSLPFEPGVIGEELVQLLERGGVLERRDGRMVSALRVSSLDGLLLLHSAFPTEGEDAVFFGPDTYRFAAFIERELPALRPGATVVDIGAGSGAGALTAGRLRPGLRLVATDVNPNALRLARVNAAAAGLAVETLETDGLREAPGRIDVALANPPYMMDEQTRAYRDGGGLNGGELSLRLAREAAERLAPGGRLLLYTGAAIVAGEDRLRAALERAMAEAGCDLAYLEIDPDVFGEELERPRYAEVERIAVVGAVAVKRR